MDRIAVSREMENARHFGPGIAVGSGKGHRQRTLNRIGRQTKIVIAASELLMKIDSKFVGRLRGEIEIGSIGQANTQSADDSSADFHFANTCISYGAF